VISQTKKTSFPKRICPQLLGITDGGRKSKASPQTTFPSIEINLGGFVLPEKTRFQRLFVGTHVVFFQEPTQLREKLVEKKHVN